jgi:hypothetical protein
MKTLILLFSVLFTTMSFAQVPSYVPANGLVGWWPFNGNANDESGNGNNGTVNGATLSSDRFGNVNATYSFNGSNVLIPLTQQIVSMSERTFSLWFYSAQAQSGGRLFEATNYSWGIGCYNSTTFDCWYQKSNQAYNIVGESFQDHNEWYNLVFICDSSTQQKKLYLNGNLINTGTPETNPPNPLQDDYINHFLKIGQGNANESFIGLIDDIGIWNRALTQQEITNLYTSTVPVSCLPAYVPTSGLVGYWPFCGNANDESGNGNNGTVNGATLTTDRNGNVNSAYSFDGINDYIIGLSNSFPANQRTVSVWFFSNNIGIGNLGRGVLGYGGNTCGQSWNMHLDNPGSPLGLDSYEVNTHCNVFSVASSYGSLIPNGNWHNWVVSTNPNGTYFYLDGNLIQSSNQFINNTIVTNKNFVFGTFTNPNGIGASINDPNNTVWNGTLDDIGIWNRALTQQEITNLYTSTVPPTAAVLSGDATICNGSSTNLNVAVTGGTAPYTVTVTNGTVNYSATGASPVTIPVSPSVTSTYSIVSVTGGGSGTGNTGTATVTVIPNSTNTTPISACDSYAWNGQTYTQSGIYTGTTTDCVTESLDLTITPSSTNTTTASACDSYTWNGTTYSASGVYTGTTTDCVTQSLNLTITPSSTNTSTASACDSYTWNGTNYSESGVYTGTTANCVTESLNLTITPSSTNTTTATACNSLTWNGQTYTQSGVYTGTTANCVTQALNLTINTNTSSSISQTALDSYTWPVNSQTYTTTGAYTAVIPNAAGCDSTITLNLTMSFTGINDLSASKLSVYPNPTNGDFTITGLELVGTVSSLILTDMNGKVVKVLDTKATKFSMASIKPGVYFLNIISGNKQEVLKIVKE